MGGQRRQNFQGRETGRHPDPTADHVWVCRQPENRESARRQDSGHDFVASQALTNAKKLEKKLEEKGVINIAKMGFAVAKSQFENLKKKI